MQGDDQLNLFQLVALGVVGKGYSGPIYPFAYAELDRNSLYNS